MSSCISCKSKTSSERCPNRSIIGLSFCGKHVRSPTKRIWHVENKVDCSATIIQKCWRGYTVRYRLRLAGTGVLRRSLCHNDEDVVTFESKDKQHPFDYFSFEEDGKVWWFDILSIIGCLNSNLIPTNPYTRQALNMDTRNRLRQIYKYRLHNRLPIAHSPASKKSYNELIETQWMKITQILHENGFDDANPNHFLSLDNRNMFILLDYIYRDMTALAMEHPSSSKRYRWASAIKRERDIFHMNQYANLQTSTLILSLLNAMNEPYPFCFILMSALFRV